MKKKTLITIFITVSVLSLVFLFGCATDRDKADDALKTALELQTAFRKIADDVLPVVVELEVIEVTTQTTPEGDDFPFSPWHFGPFDPEQDLEREREFLNKGIGSGVIVQRRDSTYYVLTNEHVVGKADTIRIFLFDERSFIGEVVGTDERKDLALIKFTSEDRDIPIAVLGDSDETRVGDWVVAVGSPYGYHYTITSGIVSAMGRRGPFGNISDFIQTDAAINQGNSGGALINLRGEVIAINTWISTPTGGNIGLSFSIPINNVKKAIRDFIEVGEVRYGWLGISIAEIIPDAAKDLGVDNMDGAFVYHVFLDSPAHTGGIQPGDYITTIDNIPVEDSNHLIFLVGNLEPNKTLTFTLVRNGKKKKLDVTIGLRADAETISNHSEDLWPGIGVIPLSENIKKEFEVENTVTGVIVSEVEPKTPFQELGVRFGDILTEINGKGIETMQDFYTVLNSVVYEKIEVTIYRNGTKEVLTMNETAGTK